MFELRKARERAHILEGLAVALANIDEVIALIKASPRSPAEAQGRPDGARLAPAVRCPSMLARAGAVARPVRTASSGVRAARPRATGCPRRQAQAILDLRLHRLTGLEQDKILAEYEEILLNGSRRSAPTSSVARSG